MKRVLRSQSDFRKTILRNQLTSLILFESITTTKANSKYLIPFANHFFNSVKKADLIAKKLSHQLLLDSNAIKKTFEEILPRYKNEETTFIRSYKVAPRRGDSAEMVMISFIHPLTVETTNKKSEKNTINTETK
jgi:large subunit ribosomal protein L17